MRLMALISNYETDVIFYKTNVLIIKLRDNVVIFHKTNVLIIEQCNYLQNMTLMSLFSMRLTFLSSNYEKMSLSSKCDTNVVILYKINVFITKLRDNIIFEM